MAASLDRWGTSLAIDGVKLDELALLGRTLAGLLAFLFCWPSLAGFALLACFCYGVLDWYKSSPASSYCCSLSLDCSNLWSPLLLLSLLLLLRLLLRPLSLLLLRLLLLLLLQLLLRLLLLLSVLLLLLLMGLGHGGGVGLPVCMMSVSYRVYCYGFFMLEL